MVTRADNNERRRPKVEPAPPLVSVVITTYDRPSYLRKAVESVRDQTYDNIELVVVDDHSKTPAIETLSAIDTDSFADLRCIRHDENRGANVARNTGVRAVNGEYVAFLDDDDRWVPEKIERQVRRFEAAEESVGVVYTGIETVRNGEIGEEIPPPIEGDITKALLCRNVVGTMSTIMVRSEIAKATPFDEQFPAWADLEWYINLSRRTEFSRIPDPLVVYEFTSDHRLSDDFEKAVESYELFVERFDPVAAEYGRLFRRKMRGWAAYRVGASGIHTGHYERPRRFLLTATTTYPFEPTFWKYLLVSFGGRPTHRIVRRLKRHAT